MIVVYSNKLNKIEIAEKSLFRKYIFRRVNICNENDSGTFFTRNEYLKGDWIELCIY